MHYYNIWQKHSQTIKKLVRYGVIGITTNGIAFGLYLLMTYLGLTPRVSLTILYSVAATLSYFGNRRLTFTYSGSWLWSSIRYIIMHIGGYFLNLGLLYICVDIYEIPHQYVQFAAIFIVAIYLFVVSDWFVFPKNTTSKHT